MFVIVLVVVFVVVCWLRSGGEHCHAALAVEVRGERNPRSWVRGTLPSYTCSWGEEEAGEVEADAFEGS